MSLYEKYCLPHFLNFACNLKVIQKQREKIVPKAKGKVLEVGMGSGLNIAYYDPKKIDLVWGLEPSEGMRKKAQPNLKQAKIKVEWLGLPGEAIPLEDQSVDTVLLTYTLCTIPDYQTALKQMRRVLKPQGQLLFSEHGKAPDLSVQKWQDRLDPFWQKLAGGCHLNRPIPQLIQEAGFKIQKLESQYLPGPKFATFTYWGMAN